MAKRRLAILGSTGSIGTQTLDVVSKHPDIFEVELLTAYSNTSLLIEQAVKFNANAVVICDEKRYNEVQEALIPHDIKVFAGTCSIEDLVQGSNIDIVVTAMVGFSGLKPTLSAIKAGKIIALANKETLVVAGEIVTSLAEKSGSAIIPVDSEHSAIFQCLQGERAQIEKIILTASGGPFLHTSKDELSSVTVEQALNHPKWQMGAKVSIDSATMMNKGLELIEAYWLFKQPVNKIDIVIHPQSVIHSMVQFSDGSVSAQMSIPDMRLPIQYAISYPYRIDLDTERIDFAKLSKLDFIAPDREKFRTLDIAYKSITMGGNSPCAMNAANEIAVASFLNGEIPFSAIAEIIEDVVSKFHFIEKPTLENIFETDLHARELALKHKIKLKK
jgi:1-deoxy-D-xylulose-5-phosphate reductoisomerase